jgi:hypothetical protein
MARDEGLLMYCPRCGVQDDLNQGYCRRCGQALAVVQLAIDGQADESLERLKASAKRIGQGTTTIVVFTFIALAITLAGLAIEEPVFGFIALLNLLLGLSFGLPLVFLGRSSLNRAARLLSRPDALKYRSGLEHRRSEKVITGDLNVSLREPGPSSVTDHTTLDLEHHAPRRRP